MTKPHPFQIAVGRNEQMNCWEAHLMVGNFPTEADAEKMAEGISEFMEKHCNADVLREQ